MALSLSEAKESNLEPVAQAALLTLDGSHATVGLEVLGFPSPEPQMVTVIREPKHGPTRIIRINSLRQLLAGIYCSKAVLAMLCLRALQASCLVKASAEALVAESAVKALQKDSVNLASLHP